MQKEKKLIAPSQGRPRTCGYQRDSTEIPIHFDSMVFTYSTETTASVHDSDTSFSESRDKTLSRRSNIIDCHRGKRESIRESLNTRTCWSKEERIVVNFSRLCRNFVEDVKLSRARILDLSLCRTLEMNPRKG